MGRLYIPGRIFYGLSIAAMGVITLLSRDFPYMLIPAQHPWVTDHVTVVYLSGALLFLAGLGIALTKKRALISLVLGAVLFLIFCFYFVPYQLIESPNYRHAGDWENALKELGLAAGAWVFAGKRWTTVGTVLFSLTILCFGLFHFLYAREAAGYIPSWVPGHLFWMYFTGTALIASNAAILLRIQPAPAAALLGSMILIWVIILHTPKAIAYGGGEITSGFLALAYCGVAYAVAGASHFRMPLK